MRRISQNTGRSRINLVKVSKFIGQLRAARIDQNLSLDRLAKILGYNPYSIGSWERGKMVPSLLKFIDWAEALGYELQLRKDAKSALAEIISFPSKQQMMGNR